MPQEVDKQGWGEAKGEGGVGGWTRWKSGEEIRQREMFAAQISFSADAVTQDDESPE